MRGGSRVSCLWERDVHIQPPRLAARERGKVLHYRVAVPFVAVAAASISAEA